MSARRRGDVRPPGGEGGFTLVELLVTIVILGVLAAIAIPALLTVRGRAQDTAAKAELRQALGFAREYYVANGRYSPDEAAMRAFHPSVEWASSAGVNTTMGTDADVGRIYFESDGPDFLVLGSRSASGRCFYLYSRPFGGGEQVFYASPPDPADCRDPWDYRTSTNAAW